MEYEAFQKQNPVNLSPQQEAAVRATDGYVLLLAVPGSGKTTVLVTRVAYMILCRGIAPERILTLTYTRAATADMHARFASLFGDATAERVQFRTLNGICAMIIRRYEQFLGHQAFALMEDEGKLNALVRELYQAQLHEYPTDGEVKNARAYITYAKNMMLTDGEIEGLNKDFEGFSALYHAYLDRLCSQGLMDYDDQMVYALRILKKYPEILSDFQDRFPYLCVDEAQDTSKIQHQIISLLAEKHGNLFMVGDEDQSIYGFRAAYPEALLEFERAHPGAKVLLMETNYRSTPEIVAKADAFIQKNRDRHPKHMSADRPSGAAVRRISLKSRSGQYAYLREVASDCKVRTAVLYRDNDCALPLIDLLEREHIPYAARRLDLHFFGHRVVQEICDIIRMAEDPCNGELFLKHYYKLSSRINRAAANRAAAKAAPGESFFHYLAERDDSLPPYQKKQCRALNTHFEHLLSLPADQAIFRIVNYMGYGDYLKERGSDLSKPQILEILGKREPTPLDLLRRLGELEALLQNKVSEPCNFILSTVHSAKGLEYDRVFLMDAVDGIMPKTGDDVDGNEERRIFYVAMTRAKNELNIFDLSGTASASFCEEVFAKPPAPKDAAAAADMRKAASPGIQPPKNKLSPRLKAALKDCIPGRRVQVPLRGSGRIKSVREDLIVIRFDTGEERKYDPAILLKNPLFQFE